MEPIESSETSAYINTLTPGTYPKEKKLQSKHGESLKSRICLFLINSITCFSPMGHHLLGKNGRINIELRMETEKSVSCIDIYLYYI